MESNHTPPLLTPHMPAPPQKHQSLTQFTHSLTTKTLTYPIHPFSLPYPAFPFPPNSSLSPYPFPSRSSSPPPPYFYIKFYLFYTPSSPSSSLLNMPRIHRRRLKPVTIDNHIILRATDLSQVGRVVVAPRLGVKGAVSSVGNAVD